LAAGSAEWRFASAWIIARSEGLALASLAMLLAT
jgi:hypothetical protein